MRTETQELKTSTLVENIKKYWILIFVGFVICMFTKPVLCAFIMGGLFIFISLFAILFLRKIKLIGERSEGDLVDYEMDHDGDKIPIIKFQTNNGSTIEGKPYVFTSAFFALSRLSRAKKHVPIPILYLPKSPEKFIVNNQTTLDYSILIFFLMIGIAFTVLGILQLSGKITVF